MTSNADIALYMDEIFYITDVGVDIGILDPLVKHHLGKEWVGRVKQKLDLDYFLFNHKRFASTDITKLMAPRPNWVVS